MTPAIKAKEILAKLAEMGEEPKVGDTPWTVIDIHDHVDNCLGIGLNIDDTDLFGELLKLFNIPAKCTICSGEQEPVDSKSTCKTCREWDASEGQIKFSYTLSGTVDLNGIAEDQAKKILHINLDELTTPIMGDGLITGCSNLTLDSYESVVQVGPGPVAYPINHGQHIIQFHDETSAWYDEAGLQGGVEYSLKQAELSLKRYADDLNGWKPDLTEFEPITQKGYEPGEIPHQFGDLMEYAGKLLEQNEAMRDVMARAGMQICLAKARKAMEDSVTIPRDAAQRLQERLDPHRDAKDWGILVGAMLGTAKIVCKHCGWYHINTTETCDDATARERGKP